jgi:hypothetical protein
MHGILQAACEAVTAGDLDALRAAAGALPAGALFARDNWVTKWAAYSGCLPCLQWLATQPGVDLGAEDDAALRSAGRQGHHDVVAWLGAQRGAAGLAAAGFYALAWAAREGHLATVKVLVQDLGVSPEDDRHKPLRWAVSHGRVGVAQYLFGPHGRVSPDGQTSVLILAAKVAEDHVVAALAAQAPDALDQAVQLLARTPTCNPAPLARLRDAHRRLRLQTVWRRVCPSDAS